MSDLYEQRGVSAGKEEVHAAIKHLDKGLFPNAFCKILPNYLSTDQDSCLIMHTDTAGTKPILAYMYWRETGDVDIWKGIVQDALVMNLDDMACSGLTSGFVVSSNIARNKSRIPGEVLSTIIGYAQEYLEGLSQFGIQAHLAGGETADVGDLVRTIDVGYTVVGALKKHEVIDISIQPGAVIIGVSSAGTCTYEPEWNSGIGSNGLTSARHDMLHKAYGTHYPESVEPTLDDAITYIGKYALTDRLEGIPVDVGHMLLSPTRSYLPLLQKIIPAHRGAIQGIIHCTGGGQTKVIHFAKEGLRIVKDNLLPVPAVFRHIQQAAGTPWKEMYRTFNMGQRLEIYIAPGSLDAILQAAASLGLQAQVVGRVEQKEGASELQVHHGEEVFSYAP